MYLPYPPTQSKTANHSENFIKNPVVDLFGQLLLVPRDATEEIASTDALSSRSI